MENKKPIDKKKLGIGLAVGAAAGIGIWYLTKAKEGEEPQVYVCPYCGQIFLTADEVEAHIFWYHSDEPPVEPEPEPPPPIEEPVILSNLVVPTEPVSVREPIYVKFDATNPNDTQVVAIIIVSGDFSMTIEKVLPPNSTTTITFLIKVEAPGTYLIRVDGLEGYITAEVLPVELSNLTASPQVVTIGEKVRINVTVGNPNWGTSVTYLVQLTGAVQVEKEITLLSHETRTVFFLCTVNWQAWGTIYCNGLSVNVKGEVYVGPDEPMPPDWDDELERELILKYREFLDQLVMEATGGAGGYMSPAWFSMLTMQEKHDLTEEAEDMARRWFYDTYGYWWPY